MAKDAWWCSVVPLWVGKYTWLSQSNFHQRKEERSSCITLILASSPPNIVWSRHCGQSHNPLLHLRSGVTRVEGIEQIRHLQHQLPNGLEHLIFGHDFNQSLEQVTLLSRLRTLTFGVCFNQSLERVNLPQGLQTLTFGYHSNRNRRLEQVNLPNSLQTLKFGDRFNQSLEPVTMPNSLRMLTFGRDFNRSLELVTLPNSLQTLTLGAGFNHSLEQVTLPNSLRMLTFGRDFNRSLELVTLPNSLQTLTLGAGFNHSLEQVTLPNSLRTLTLGSDFNRSLEQMTLPNSLETLRFGTGFNQSLEQAKRFADLLVQRRFCEQLVILLESIVKTLLQRTCPHSLVFYFKFCRTWAPDSWSHKKQHPIILACDASSCQYTHTLRETWNCVSFWSLILGMCDNSLISRERKERDRERERVERYGKIEICKQLLVGCLVHQYARWCLCVSFTQKWFYELQTSLLLTSRSLLCKRSGWSILKARSVIPLTCMPRLGDLSGQLSIAFRWFPGKWQWNFLEKQIPMKLETSWHGGSQTCTRQELSNVHAKMEELPSPPELRVLADREMFLLRQSVLFKTYQDSTKNMWMAWPDIPRDWKVHISSIWCPLVVLLFEQCRTADWGLRFLKKSASKWLTFLNT